MEGAKLFRQSPLFSWIRVDVSLNPGPIRSSGLDEG